MSSGKVSIHPMTPQILIVDDDIRLCGLLSHTLGQRGLGTASVGDARALWQLWGEQHFDLLVLDINLPVENGFAICQRLREMGETLPILMLTGVGDVMSRIRGLETGANDYLAKPFHARELLARINNLLPRPDRPTPAICPQPVTFGPFLLNPALRQLYRKGQPLPVTGEELALLILLASRPGQAFSRDELSCKIRGRERQYDQRGIDMLVSRLRKRLGENGEVSRHIQSVRGVGYMFVPAGLADAS